MASALRPSSAASWVSSSPSIVGPAVPFFFFFFVLFFFFFLFTDPSTGDISLPLSRGCSSSSPNDAAPKAAARTVSSPPPSSSLLELELRICPSFPPALGIGGGQQGQAKAWLGGLTRRRTKARACLVCMCSKGVSVRSSRKVAECSHNRHRSHHNFDCCALPLHCLRKQCPPFFTPDRPHFPITGKPGNFLHCRAGIVALRCVGSILLSPSIKVLANSIITDFDVAFVP